MMNKVAAIVLTCVLGSWAMQSHASLMGVTLDRDPQLFNFTFDDSPATPGGPLFVPDTWRILFSSLPTTGDLFITIFEDLNGGGNDYGGAIRVSGSPFPCEVGLDCDAALGGFSAELSYRPEGTSVPQQFTVDLSGIFEGNEGERQAVVTSTEVPTPAPLALLSLGLIFLVRRLS